MTRWYVYVIHSRSLDRFYTGIATDAWRRLEQHNKGKGAKATRMGRPWKMRTVYPLRMNLSKSGALKEEARIKKLSHAEKEKLFR